MIRQTKTCSIGKTCKNTCIAKQNNCRVEVSSETGKTLDSLKETIQIASGENQAKTAQQVQLKKVEDKIVMNKTGESTAIIDEEGKELFSNYKDGHKVGIPKSFKGRLQGAIITHNHPSAWDYEEGEIGSKGTSFSPADIKGLQYFDAAEMRAVTRGYNHSLKPPKEGWKHNAKDIDEIHKKATEDLKKYVKKEVDKAMANKDFKKALKISNKYKEDKWHIVMNKVAKQLGAEYTREER